MNIRLVKLYDMYAALLSDRQREIMDLYYNEDESLAEIAENTGITRQGVRDWIKKTEAQLEGFEAALKLVDRSERLLYQLQTAKKALEKGNVRLASSAITTAEGLLP
ncbi:MAG: helix-turn-helix domain-containing protein [Clostridia bacterium]|nr:helix-turn-helix domain-containing protein [Clostridia bacterium]